MWKAIQKSAIPSLILTIPRMFLRGIVLYVCFLWFLTPFFGIPAPQLLDCVGLAGLISILTFEHIGRVQDPIEAWRRVGEWTLAVASIIAVLFIIHMM